MGRALDITTPEVFEPLLRSSQYKALHGGRGGAKSHFFADHLIERCLIKKPTRAVCVREFQTTLEESVKRLLEDKLDAYDLRDGHGFRVLDSRIETPGDGIIIFQGMQSHNATSIKSLEGYDVAWVEEAQNFSQRSLTLLDPTIRRPGSELWFSWNPRYATDPVDDFFRGNGSRSRGVPWSPPGDAIVVRANWQDNPFFPEVLRQKMERDRRRDPELYAHVWEGDYERRAESRVFKNYVVERFDDVEGAQYLYGADWGFSQDPSTLVRMRVNDTRLFISHEAYAVGVEIDDLGGLFDTVPGCRDFPIVADSARPETISYLRRHGFPLMRAAVKGPNSVIEGIRFLQNYDIVIHPRCEHAVAEFAHYRYKTDKKTEKVTYPLQLEDERNHVIDPCRYGTEELRREVVDDWLVA